MKCYKFVIVVVVFLDIFRELLLLLALFIAFAQTENKVDTPLGVWNWSCLQCICVSYRLVWRRCCMVPADKSKQRYEINKINEKKKKRTKWKISTLLMLFSATIERLPYLLILPTICTQHDTQRNSQPTKCVKERSTE